MEDPPVAEDLVAVATRVVLVSMEVRSAVAEWSHMGLAAVEVAWDLAECACQMVSQTLRALDLASPHLGIHHPGNLCTTDDPLDP
jgi:hypothetical protein